LALRAPVTLATMAKPISEAPTGPKISDITRAAMPPFSCTITSTGSM
jgi:hypothetical protein